MNVAGVPASAIDGDNGHPRHQADDVVILLNEVLAAELVGVERYKMFYFAAEVLEAQKVADEFLSQAVHKADHADVLAARITELGGSPALNPASLLRTASTEHDTALALAPMIDRCAEEQGITVERFAGAMARLKRGDPTTGQLIGRIVAQERAHLSDLMRFRRELALP